MEGIWKHKYDLFLQELSTVSSITVFDESSIEKSFRICNHTLEEIKLQEASIINHPAFLKNVYPYFLAEAEYLKYIAYLLLFCPAEKTTQRLLFLEREKQRLQKFEHVNHSFLNYYKSGSTKQDEFYFGDTAWHYVTVLSGWLALKKYNLYIDLIL
jgi:hypothetical protein